MKERVKWLDISRGICIMLMVICHASSGRWPQFNGYTGMFFLVFFLVSAGICFDKKSNLKAYIKKQFVHVIVPYLVITIVILLAFWKKGAIPGASRIEKAINAVASLFWGLSNEFDVGNIHTIGVGPIWFFLMYFISTVLYKVLYNFKWKNYIIIPLALISSISQSFIVLPLALQSSLVALLFIWLGDCFKKYWFSFADYWKKAKFFKLIISIILFGAISIFVLAFFYYLAGISSGRFLDLGSNNYSILSLIPSILEMLILIQISVLIERTEIIDDLLVFCGKNTFTILIIHSLDICIIRNWYERDISFMISAILFYPVAAYIINRFCASPIFQKKV